jgi:cytochrome c-type biogenesis protein CcmH/NrfG
VPIADALVERRVYLPSIGLMIAIAALIVSVPAVTKKPLVWVAILLVLSGLTFRRNLVYANSDAMWEDSLQGNPRNSRAHFQLAYAYYTQNRCADSVREYTAGAALQKADYRMNVDWALALECTGDTAKALERLKEATSQNPGDSHAWATLGMIYGKSGRMDEALIVLHRALELNGNDENALMYRGNVYVSMGNLTSAIQDYEHALKVRPDLPGAQQGLATARQMLAAPR